MIRKILISIFLLIIILIVPFKLIGVFLNTKMTENLPTIYRNIVPKSYLKDHVYSIVSDKKVPISFFRAKDVDFVTTQINLKNIHNFIINHQEPLSINNETYELFNFTNSTVLNIYDNTFKDNQINQISFNGMNAKVFSKSRNFNILKFSSDFEILLNKKRFFYIETKKDMFVILKNANNNSQIFILEIDDKSHSNVLTTFE